MRADNLWQTQKAAIIQDNVGPDKQPTRRGRSRNSCLLWDGDTGVGRVQETKPSIALVQSALR